MTRHTRSIIVAMFVTSALAAGPASAQPAQAQAEHLFREGKRLMGEGNIAAACDAFEGSYAKDPAVSTLLNLADCREKNQQYASAWGYFIEAGRKTRNKPDMAALNKTAEQRATGIEPRLSYLIINVPDEARVEGLTITRNGVAVDVIEWNRDVPVDGGTYRVEGKAPAFEPWSTTITVGNAKDKQSVNVPRFRNALPGADLSTDTPAVTEVAPWYRDPLGWTLVGVGAAASAGGVAFLLQAGNAEDDANRDLLDPGNWELIRVPSALRANPA